MLKALPNAPVAAVESHRSTHHGISLADPYHWLRDPGYPEVKDERVLDYLKAENAYFESAMAPRKALVDTLFEEMKARLKEDESSVPQKDGDFLYWWAFDKDAQYRKWYRKPVVGGTDQVILDEPALAEGKQYFRLGGATVSPDGRLIAYAIDDDGSERYKLRIRDLATDEDLETVSDTAIGAPEWSADSAYLAYTEVDENWRPLRVRLHRLGTPGGEQDPVIYEEADKGFFVGIHRSQDRSHWIISAGDQVTSEARLVPTDDPTATPRLVSPRRKDRQYDVDVRERQLYIRVNDTHPNYRIVTAPLNATEAWEELIPGSDRHYIRGLTTFRDLLAVTERIEGLDQLRLRSYDGQEHYVRFPEASYSAGLGHNPEYAPTQLRIGYQSMVTPSTVYDYDLASRELIVRKVQEIPSGYDASQYETVRLMAPARDGTKVPVSVVYRKGFPKDGSGKIHIYAYGAYGHAIPPVFSTSRLSMLDRGFAYAIAHIRGGDDLGRQWYFDGKLNKRMNTFTDFVDVTRFLIDQDYARLGKVSASGGSAGGELMGAIANMAPELYGAIVAHVPFVDVLNTMLDDTLPLTPPEWPEWGNPIIDREAFEYIRGYSPYDNVEAKAYPSMLVTGGLNDPRVTYWEPAKWVARLRATKTDDNLLLFKINMGAGHGGKSGRFESLRETAEEFAFITDALGD